MLPNSWPQLYISYLHYYRVPSVYDNAAHQAHQQAYLWYLYAFVACYVLVVIAEILALNATTQ